MQPGQIMSFSRNFIIKKIISFSFRAGIRSGFTSCSERYRDLVIDVDILDVALAWTFLELFHFIHHVRILMPKRELEGRKNKRENTGR
jgi:hypothetical protein